jgi:NitT/TauT family transport system substrate-binding protein
MRKSLAAIVATLVAIPLALGLSACGSDDGATDAGATTAAPAKIAGAEPGTIRMATEPWLGYGPWYVAQDNALFEAQGIEKVDIKLFDSDAPLNAALLAGEVDVANIATHTALRFAAAGAPITIVLQLDNSLQADAIIAEEGIASVADLKGKTVAYEEGTTSDLLLNYALGLEGLSGDDITKSLGKAAEVGTTLLAGRVPAAVTYEPYISETLKKKAGFKVLAAADIKPGLISDVLVVRNDYLKDHPGQIAALVRTWQAAVDEYTTNTAGAQKSINAGIGYDPGPEAYKGVQFIDTASNDINGTFATVVADVLKAATDAKIITEPIDPATLLDGQYVAAANAG